MKPGEKILESKAVCAFWCCRSRDFYTQPAWNIGLDIKSAFFSLLLYLGFENKLIKMSDIERVFEKKWAYETKWLLFDNCLSRLTLLPLNEYYPVCRVSLEAIALRQCQLRLLSEYSLELRMTYIWRKWKNKLTRSFVGCFYTMLMNIDFLRLKQRHELERRIIDLSSVLPYTIE